MAKLQIVNRALLKKSRINPKVVLKFNFLWQLSDWAASGPKTPANKTLRSLLEAIQITYFSENKGVAKHAQTKSAICAITLMNISRSNVRNLYGRVTKTANSDFLCDKIAETCQDLTVK